MDQLRVCCNDGVLYVRLVTRIALTFSQRSVRSSVKRFSAPRSSIYAGTFSALEEDVQFLHTLTADVCAQNGISLLDLSVSMRDAYAENGRHFESEFDFHWNEYGHEYVAGELGEFLQGHLLDAARARYDNGANRHANRAHP